MAPSSSSSSCRTSVFIFFFIVANAILLSFLQAPSAEAYDPLDPNGNITIKWDIMSWTGDGYVAVVSIYNFQQYRHMEAPGWALGWAWAEREVIWAMVGAQATLQGDCSRFRGGAAPPHSCVRSPRVVDLLPGVAYSSQVAKCCRGGVLSSWAQDPSAAVASFQITVGESGSSNATVRLPANFTLRSPGGPGYSCGPAMVVRPSLFSSADARRNTQAFMTWNVTCTYSQFLAQRGPTCCVSFSSFYNDTIVPCPACACGCHNSSTCFNSPPLQSVLSSGPNALLPHQTAPQIHCTNDMCPIRLHWHVKQNYKSYWRVKLTISNRNYAWNYSQWNVVVQHPNFHNLSEVFSFTYKSLNPYGSAINDTAMFWGIKYYNDLLMQAGEDGNVQSELLFQKDKDTFSFSEGWAFPQRVYFNGDACVLPPPDAYPSLPNGISSVKSSASALVALSLMAFALVFFL